MVANVDQKHPLYTANIDKWSAARDAYSGQFAVKSKRDLYLPKTSAMIMDWNTDDKAGGFIGQNAYNAYLKRARFPEFMRRAVATFVGMLWQQAPTIELPERMKGILTRATPNGESLALLMRRINEEQLITGRCGLLADWPSVVTDDALPYISLYNAESIINWDANEFQNGERSLNMVVLDESGYRRSNVFDWTKVSKYRALFLGDELDNENSGAYYQRIYSEADDGSDALNETDIVPKNMGARIEQIPFVFVNSSDIVAEPSDPPMMELVNATFAAYRNDADYQQALFMQSQDTLIISGDVPAADRDVPIRTGAGAVIRLEQGASAQYIGVNSQGLPEQRQAVQAGYAFCAELAGQLTGESVNIQSGKALQTRMAAQTASLKQIALTCAAATERVLKIIAEWVGANPAEVKVTANTEFVLNDLSGQDLTQILTAKGLGAPLSQESIHDTMRRGGYTSLTYDEEMKKLGEESNNGI